MGKGKWMITVLTVLLLLAVTLVDSTELDRKPEFTLSSQWETERLTAWEKEPGEFYVFLPSYGKLSQLQLQDTGGIVRLGDTMVEQGMSCQAFGLNQRYTLQYDQGDAQGSLTFVQSAYLPTLFIDTDSHAMDYIHKEKGNEEPGSIRLYSSQGTVDYAGRLESIKMRGNNTDYQEKKPYSLKLSQEADLLGMGTAQRWVLLSNSFDSSHMRNKIVYDFASEFGLTYSPECQWVDVFLNGEYAGLYLLSERNEVHPQRVALTEEEHFLVSRDRLSDQNLPHTITSRGAPLRIHDCTLDMGTLGEAWFVMENAVEGEGGMDPSTGQHWSELIDLDSWAKKFLIEEVFGNVDGAIFSQFFYMDGPYPGSKIFAGPVWDYDMAIGNQRYWKAVTPEMLYLNRPENCGGSYWYYSLWQDATFRSYVTQLYSRQFLPLLDVFLEERISANQVLIQQAALTNQLRWETVSLEPELEHIKSYMRRRVDFLSHLWLDGAEDYVTLSVAKVYGSQLYATYVLQPGATMLQIPLDWDNNWYTVEDDKPFDITQPITSDIRIYHMAEAVEMPPAAEESWLPEWGSFAAIGLILVVLCLADWIRSNRNGEEKPHARWNKVSP